jgi:hypothetical protein
MAKGDRKIAQFRQRQFINRIQNEIRFRREFLRASNPFGERISRAFLNEGIEGVERINEAWGLAIRESMHGEYVRIFSSQSVATFDFLVNSASKKQERLSPTGVMLDFDDLALAFATTNALENSLLIASTRIDRAKSLINRGLKDGLSEVKIAKNLKNVYSGTISKFHASSVARTEVGNATQHAAFKGAKTSNVDLTKQWLTVQDSAVRDIHAALDQVKVEIDATFDNGMLHPNDPAGGPSNTINCRCVINYIPKTST